MDLHRSTATNDPERATSVAAMSVPVVGRTYRLAEDSYRYGIGTLDVTITKIMTRTHFGDPADPWYRVQALVSVPGLVGPSQDRELYVRGASLV